MHMQIIAEFMMSLLLTTTKWKKKNSTLKYYGEELKLHVCEWRKNRKNVIFIHTGKVIFYASSSTLVPHFFFFLLYFAKHFN